MSRTPRTLRASASLAATPLVLVLVGCQGETTTITHPQDGAAHDVRTSPDAPEDQGPTDAGPTSPFTVFHHVANGETLNAIAGWDENHFIAVGDREVSYVFKDGKLSRLGGDVAGSDFRSVWGSSPTDVYAAAALAAGGGQVAHYDGTSWTTVFKTSTRLNGIWGTFAGTREVVMTVGEDGICYGYAAGSTWQTIDSLPTNPGVPAPSHSPRLTAITGLNFNDFAITSNGAQFFHYEPEAGGLVYYRPVVDPSTNFTTAWQVPDAGGTSIYLGSNFYGLYWFTSPDTPTDASVFVDGSGGYTLAGISTDPKAPGAKSLSVRGIWGTSKKVVAVGDQAQIMVLDLASAHVGIVSGPPGVSGTFGGVWGSSLSDIWIVGPEETLLHGSLP